MIGIINSKINISKCVHRDIYSMKQIVKTCCQYIVQWAHILGLSKTLMYSQAHL